MGRIAKEVLKATKKAAKEAKVSRAEQLEALANNTLPGVKKAAKEGTETLDVLTKSAADEAAAKVDVDIPEPKMPETTPAPVLSESVQKNTDIPVRKEITVATLDEARRIDEARLTDFDTTDTHQFNFDTWRTNDDVTAAMADRAEQIKSRIEVARRGKITEDDLRGLADALDWDKDVIQTVLEREVGSLDNIKPETILAARQILEQSAERIKELAHKIHSGHGTDIDRLTFRRQLALQTEFTNNFLENFMGIRAESGRLLNAFGVPLEGMDIDVAAIRELVDVAVGHDTDRIVKTIVDMGDTISTKKISGLSRQYNQSKIMGVLNELFINSILAGPKTLFVNLGGNTAMLEMNIAERAMAARMGRFMNSEEGAIVGEASAMMVGQLTAFNEALVLAGRTMKTGVALDDVVKFEGLRRRSISAEHIINEPFRTTHLGRALSVILDGYKVGGKTRVPGVGPIIRAPTERLMLPTDEFYKTIAYRAELTRLAFRDAYNAVKAGDLESTPEAIEAFVREFMENPTPRVVKAADDFSRVITFQNPLGPGGQKFQLAFRSFSPLSLIAPFIRTPGNIYKASILERSPLAVANREWREALKAGGDRQQLALAKFSMGSMTSAMVAFGVLQGKITGGGPTNPGARAIKEETGWRPYSFQDLEGRYHSYRRLEPFAFIIGATADTVEILAAIQAAPPGFYAAERDQIMTEVIPAIVTGIANNTISKTYLQGVVDFTEAMNDPQRYMPGYLNKMATSIAPYSAARRQVSAIDDPYLRHARTLLDNLIKNSGIPGYSETLAATRNIFGEAKLKERGRWLGTMSVIPDSAQSKDPVVAELNGLMDLTKRVPVSMPHAYIGSLRLTPKEYDALVLAARTEPMESNGLTFYEALDEKMNSTAYMEATADRKVDMLKDLQTRYDDFGRRKIQRENTEGVADRLADWEAYTESLKEGLE